MMIIFPESVQFEFLRLREYAKETYLKNIA